MNRELTVLDAYTKRVYKISMLIIACSCQLASFKISSVHFAGFYDNIDERWMWAFNLMDFLFLGVGIFFIRTGFDEDGLVKKSKLIAGKYTAAMIAIIQWNAISYICPFREFWAYILLFILGEAFFFDIRLVMFTSAGLLISTAISWVLNGKYLLPLRDEYFVSNMTFRIICMMSTVICINILTYFGGKFLVEELEKYVYNDPLTHLLTRRKMSGYLQEAFDEASKGDTTFCLLMLDIDDFKKVNDSYGHDCGDEVLKGVATIISSSTKKIDKVFRWGGEEILILLKTDEKNAVAVAERIRTRIEKQTINYRDKVNVSVTVTIGLTAFDPHLDMQAMMDDVDQKLYKGKQSGKNQVIYV